MILLYLVDFLSESLHVVYSQSTTVHHCYNVAAFRTNSSRVNCIIMRADFKELLAGLNVDKAHEAVLAQNTQDLKHKHLAARSFSNMNLYMIKYTNLETIVWESTIKESSIQY